MIIPTPPPVVARQGDRDVYCLQYLDVVEQDLIFHRPSTLYVMGAFSPADQPESRYAVRVEGGTNVVAVDGQGQIIPDGVHLIVTEVPGGVRGQAGKVQMDLAVFSGSVYAPQSMVAIGTTAGSPDSSSIAYINNCMGAHCLDDAPWGSIVGREIILGIGNARDITITGSGARDAQQEAEPVAVLSWSN